jgi:hypothetical protein
MGLDAPIQQNAVCKIWTLLKSSHPLSNRLGTLRTNRTRAAMTLKLSSKTECIRQRLWQDRFLLRGQRLLRTATPVCLVHHNSITMQAKAMQNPARMPVQRP